MPSNLSGILIDRCLIDRWAADAPQRIRASESMYRFTRTFVAVGVVALLSATGAAQAAFITINNAGFETPPLANGAFNLTVAGWTNSGTSGTFDPSSSHYPGGIVPEGENVAFSNAGDAV